MSKKISASSTSALVAAVREYQKAGTTLGAAMKAQHAAAEAASVAQGDLGTARDEVARLMKKAGLTQARCSGLLLSVDDDGLAACSDHFVVIE